MKFFVLFETSYFSWKELMGLAVFHYIGISAVNWSKTEICIFLRNAYTPQYIHKRHLTRLLKLLISLSISGMRN